MAAFRFRSRRTRRLWVIGVTMAVLAAAVLFLVASASGTLSGSSFESGDGNLAVDLAGNHDWNSPVETITCPNTTPGSGTNCGTDLSKSTVDNSFGQGSKEDDPVPTVTAGSIPPNKSDLTRFYVNKEHANGNDYLYLAWERSNVLGSANMDFEFNQNSTPSANGVTPVRTAGDMLITFDFTNGGGKPVLGLLRWVTSGATSQCLSSNSLPCWGNRVDLSAAGFAEGAVNAGTVHDANPPPSGGSDLPGLTFGEAGINLTAAGVFSQTVCQHFGAAFLKSRSSASFPAELKDFIAPIAVNISNCGTLVIKKVTDPSPDPTNTSFSYSLNGPNPPNANLPKTFSLTNGQSNSTDVFAGSSFSATETIPSGWTLTSATCDNGSGTLSGNQLSGISVDVDKTTTCTFKNTARGTIAVKKVTDPAGAPDSFSFTGDAGAQSLTDGQTIARASGAEGT